MLPFVLCLASIVPAIGAAQTPASDIVVSGYVAAFNAGETPMREFLQAHAHASLDLDTAMERYRRMKADMGSLKLLRIASSEPGMVTAELLAEKGMMATFVLQLTADNPPRLRGMNVKVVMGGPGGDEEEAGPPLPSRDEASALADLESLARKAADSDDFSGAVLVARDGRILWERAAGEADQERKIPNTVATKFNVGSIGKSFTSVAVAQLVAAGRITPRDTVGKFLPDYPNPTVREKVTVQMLLDMRSGIGDFFGPRYEETPKSRLRALEDYLPLFAGSPLLFEPGQGNQYSNGGYVVLGLIIQKASGMNYYDYVQKHIFAVAGMPNTGFYPQSASVPNRANGYTARLGPPRHLNTGTLPERASSAGGVTSTLHDLLNYSQALAAGKLVGADAMKQIGRSVNGLGIAGGAPGLNATLDTDVNGYTIITMSNYDPPAAERLARDLRRVLESVRR
jgi:CubicO group peptidase (beta-lactamase class C family)